MKQRKTKNETAKVAASTVSDPQNAVGTMSQETAGTLRHKSAMVQVTAVEKFKTQEKLSPDEQTTLQESEAAISEITVKGHKDFFIFAGALHKIQSKRLYREKSPSFAAYCKTFWGYARSHANRIAGAGAIIEQLSPQGDTITLLTSEAHFRPLSKLTDEQQKGVMALIKEWIRWEPKTVITPRLVEAAVAIITPPTEARSLPAKAFGLLDKFQKVVSDAAAKLPTDASKEVRQLFTQLKKKAAALSGPRRSSGIDWTTATWNPLQGCSPASKGCDHCYAAKLVSTRLADVYPGLAKEVVKDGRKRFVFTNVIRLLPDQLGEPLRDRTPKRYFVNSMSDLFHVKVPTEFITAVFDVMKLATWHTFQVLTKRPERMAAFTQSYFANEAPPPHIWLGTSTEDQEAFDQRVSHLLETKAAVRWLSMEPLLGEIKVESLEGIDWIVVGGESGSTRAMDIAWARSIRDACAEANVAFFFKQWGDYGPDGKKLKKVKKDGLTPPPLDGVIHDAYPAVEEEQNSTEELQLAPSQQLALATNGQTANPESQTRSAA